MNKQEIMETYEKNIMTQDDLLYSQTLLYNLYNKFTVRGIVADDGIFYFTEYLGNLPVRDWNKELNGKYTVVSIDYGYTLDRIRFALIGVRGQIPLEVKK